MRASAKQLQIIHWRYYFASQFVQGKEVLEVGCGPGLGLGYLARRAKRAIGGDCTEDSLTCAREHYRGSVDLLLLDAHKLPFKDSCFDVVVAMAVVAYLHLDKFLGECHRVLKKGGCLVFCMPNKDAPGYLRSHLCSEYYSPPELLALLSQHFDAQLFGAFPIQGRPAWEKLRAVAILVAARVFNLMPKGREVKQLLSKYMTGNSLVLGHEIEDREMTMEDLQLAPLPPDSLDFQHRMIYTVAYAH